MWLELLRELVRSFRNETKTWDNLILELKNFDFKITLSHGQTLSLQLRKFFQILGKPWCSSGIEPLSCVISSAFTFIFLEL